MNWFSGLIGKGHLHGLLYLVEPTTHALDRKPQGEAHNPNMYVVAECEAEEVALRDGSGPGQAYSHEEVLVYVDAHVANRSVFQDGRFGFLDSDGGLA